MTRRTARPAAAGLRRRIAAVLALGVAVAMLVPAAPALAVQAAHDRVVSVVPSTATPDINDGRVLTMVKVGNRIIVGGTFTSVSNRNGGTTYTRNNIFAFDATSGNVDTAFAPTVNGVVNALLPGTGSTVFAGGTFTTVNGATHRNLALLNTGNGALVAGFKAASLNGAVNDLALSGGRLYVGGTFNTAGGVGHGGLVTLSPTSGALDAYMAIDVAVNHNYNGTGARAGVGVSKFDISPNGARLVAIGNFKLVEGESRDQAVIILLQPGSPVVDPNWKTTRYEPACFRNAFDSYVRDIDFAPDGSWFSIVATGGPNPGTLCDTATRFEITDTGQAVEPRWIADSGGDTLFSVAITGTALYTGGHQRWMNNAGGTDRAAPGAVPRPGLAALDPLNGIPLSWNPGRNPRGVGAQALLATAEGLYVGSDTEYIGNFRYSRPRIAFFPLAGGTAPADQNTGALPANVYLAGRQSVAGGGSSGVLYRVNTGGPALPSLDSGPAWADDSDASSPFRNTGSSSAGYPAVPAVDATVPGSTPAAVFDSERWDPGSQGDGGEMTWAFPVASGKPVEVRLYFANRYPGTSNLGQRVFDVTLEGATVLENYDIRAQTPDQTGTMRSFTLTSDGTVDLSWGHEVENPLVNAIEIIDTSAAPPPGPGLGVDDVAKRFYNGTTASATTVLPSTGIEWNRARGAFMAGGKVVYGWSDGNLYTRTFDGTNFGPAVLVDPYNDPNWSDVSTGSGQTYRGVKPNFYGQLPNVTGMFYAGGRVYYTMSGQQSLFYRGMSLDSLIVAPDPDQRTVPGSTGWADVQGIFVSGGSLYWASRIDGNLRRIAFSTETGPTGPTTVVSGPNLDGNDWRTRAMFLGPGGPPPPNQLPTASFTSSCTGLTCQFDATGSSDQDGSITGYSWSFGDTTSGSGAVTSHNYGSAGTRTVTLTVTDDDGDTDDVDAQVTAGQTNVAPTSVFTVNCDGRTCQFDGSQSGDSDGTVTGYAWDFGDGGSAATAVTSHVYAQADTYDVTLVVTDDDQATGSSTQQTEVSANQVIAFRAAAVPLDANGVTSAAITVPASVQPGDALVLVLSTNSTATGSTPTGYSLVGTQAASSAMTTRVWQKVATASDAGATVTVGLSAKAKVTLALTAYTGTRTGNPVASFASSTDAGGTSHVTPVAAAPAGSMVVSVWTDKSAAARQFTAPGGVSVRTTVAGAGTGDLAVLIADSGTPVPAGQVGGLSATVGSASSRATMLTIVLAPQS